MQSNIYCSNYVVFTAQFSLIEKCIDFGMDIDINLRLVGKTLRRHIVLLL